MMKEYYKAVDAEVTSWCKKNKKWYSDDIYTLDIETSSLFYIDGAWKEFDYSIEDYSNIPKAGLPYIWMFGINDSYYYGREFMDIDYMLHLISNPLYVKVVWVFNLSFEFGFMEDILQHYTIEKMIARDKRKPISFYVKELNILFRCAYMLTNLSLANAAKEYTKVEKKSGDLEYNKARSPLTKMSDTELGYCEYDLVTLYNIILHFRDKYKHIARIPLTSTSTVREALKKSVDYWYIRSQQELVPRTDMYLRFYWAFSGGYTHSNIIRTNKIIKDVHSKDEASAYPYVMVTEKYPCQPFRRCNPSELDNPDKRENYAYLIKVKFYNLESMYYNHYLQYEKVKANVINPITNNGRIVKCNECEYYCTDIDLDIMKANYHYDKLEIKECYKSYKKYLDIKVIRFVLDLYKKKTQLKNFTSDDPEEVEFNDSIYRMSKALLNGCFGMSCTSVLHSSNYSSNLNKWIPPEELDPDLEMNEGLSEDEMFYNFVSKKLEEAKDSYSTLFYYPVGLWITSYSRRNLVMRLFNPEYPTFDRDVIYMDTDSLKYIGNYDDMFEEYNKSVINKYKEVINYYPELTLDDFMPKDPKGIAHPLGIYEDDGDYTEFITLGAKKYCYRSADDGQLHITVSGVSKSGASALNDDIRNFKKGFVWNYYESGKLTHSYVSAQPDFTFTDIDGNIYTSHQRHAVILQPTTYKLGITDLYEWLMQAYEDDEIKNYHR